MSQNARARNRKDGGSDAAQPTRRYPYSVIGEMISEMFDGNARSSGSTLGYRCGFAPLNRNFT